MGKFSEIAITQSESDDDIDTLAAQLNPFKCGFGSLCCNDGTLETPWGNNPAPLEKYCDKDNNKVCDACNINLVVKARICENIGYKYNMIAVGGQYDLLISK